jgi:hypothetical protein
MAQSYIRRYVRMSFEPMTLPVPEVLAGEAWDPDGTRVVVLSYEQEPARLITAFANRKDPRTWSR